MENKTKRGFASMDPERQRELARKGGKKAHAIGGAHEWTPETAALAGQRGGRTHSREHLAEIGRKGGLERARRAKLRAAGFEEVQKETRL